MRLIDADKLPEHKFTRESAKGSDYMRGWNDAIDVIVDKAPTVDDNEYNRGFMHAMIMVGKEAEERPQGEWIYGNLDYSTCSNCMYSNHYGDFPFCPNCGADMRMEKNDK